MIPSTDNHDGDCDCPPYRCCPYCVDKGKSPCPHGREGGLNVDGTPLGAYGNHGDGR